MSNRWFRSITGKQTAGLLALLSLTVSAAQAEPIEITPATLVISDPALTRGLSILRFELPLEPLQRQMAMRQQVYEHVCVTAKTDNLTVQWPLFECASIGESHLVGYALLRQVPEDVVHFQATARAWVNNTELAQQTLQFRIDPAAARSGGPELLSAWAKARNTVFRTQQAIYFGADRGADNRPDSSGPTLFGQWQTIAARAYGLKTPDRAQQSRPNGRRDRPGESLNAFSLFSGEAAIQETLQQQLLNPSGGAQTLEHSIRELRGPKVPSHPFSELLANRPGGRLEIADLVPPERWFLHITQTGKALDWLQTLSESSAQLLGLSSQTYLDRALLERYLARLKLAPEFVRRLGPLARQAALFGPDLYLQHGAHISLIAEAPSAAALSTLLRLMLGVGSDEDKVFAYGQGHPAYFARHQHWLIFSTSRAEAEAALQLARRQGQGSLGQSAEFRYMLEQLPVADSGLYVYLSDPFIRAMTGPRIKIAQLRRHQARARLELVTAAALLYQADYGVAAALPGLLAGNFIDPAWLQSAEGDRITLDQQGRAQSSLYGSLAAMTPLSDLAIEAISAEEAQAYQTYVADYSRFWRTTFDPIGIRIEVDAGVRVETLILPLINNSIYDAVRAMIGGEPARLSLPAMQPSPVTYLGFQLPQAALQELEQELFRKSTAIDLNAALTGQMHIALYDAEPIIAFGSADLMGAFSGWFIRGMGRSGVFLYGSIIMSLLTQPAAIFMELREGVSVEDWMQHLFSLVDFGFGHRTLQPYGEGWVYTYTLENIVRFHLYLRQEGNYLIISNRSTPLQAVSETVAASRLQASAQANALLGIDFSQIQQLAPVLYLHAVQRLPVAWRSAVGQLAPLRWLGVAGRATAQTRLQELYGYRPELPPGSPWPWPENSAWQQAGQSLLPEFKLPAYHDLTAEQRRSGPLQDLERLQVSFKLVAEGVRVVLQLQPR